MKKLSIAILFCAISNFVYAYDIMCPTYNGPALRKDSEFTTAKFESYNSPFDEHNEDTKIGKAICQYANGTEIPYENVKMKPMKDGSLWRERVNARGFLIGTCGPDKRKHGLEYAARFCEVIHVRE